VVEQVVERLSERFTPAITDHKAAVLQQSRAMQAEGLSLQAMANRLNKQDVPTLSGKGQWQKGTIGKLLAQGNEARSGGPVPMPPSTYDADFYTWTQTQAEALRTKNLAALDLEHLAEEIESFGKRDRRAVESFLAVIVLHLLKWVYQPVRRTPSWRSSVRNARNRLALIVEDSPTLGQVSPERLAVIYRRARQGAADETGLPLATFPEGCPWPVAQVLAEDFWPEDRP
jgi:hypothetical protein